MTLILMAICGVALGALLAWLRPDLCGSSKYEHYTSTACIHNKHFDCRLVCKYDPFESCKCQCHRVEAFTGKGI